MLVVVAVVMTMQEFGHAVAGLSTP